MTYVLMQLIPGAISYRLSSWAFPEGVISLLQGYPGCRACRFPGLLRIPWDMPGYDDPVIMAAGAFVQGSSIELSADAPIRPPYVVYFQGGLTYEHSKFGVIKALQELYDRGLLDIQ